MIKTTVTIVIVEKDSDLHKISVPQAGARTMHYLGDLATSLVYSDKVSYIQAVKSEFVQDPESEKQ